MLENCEADGDRCIFEAAIVRLFKTKVRKSTRLTGVTGSTFPYISTNAFSVENRECLRILSSSAYVYYR